MAALDARAASEEDARRSLALAEGRLANGLVPVSDKLSAQTALLQATLKRQSAEADLQNARGALAVNMGLDPWQNYSVSPLGLPRGENDGDVKELTARALQHNPRVRAASATVRAAEADVVAAQALSRPTLSLDGVYSRRKDRYGSRDSFTPSDPLGDARSGFNRVEINLKIPIPGMDGHSHDVRAARARLKEKMADLYDVQTQVTAEVWKNYQDVTSSTGVTRVQNELVKSAAQLLQVTQTRYAQGAGTIADVLSAQGTLADQQADRIHSLTEWRLAKLRLAQSLGEADPELLTE
jgi:outer membrane protein